MGSFNFVIIEIFGCDFDNFVWVSSGFGFIFVEVFLFEIDSFVVGGQDFGSVFLMSFGVGLVVWMVIDGLISFFVFVSYVIEFDYVCEEFWILDFFSVELESWIVFIDCVFMLFMMIEVGGIEMFVVIDIGVLGVLSVFQCYEGQLVMDGLVECVGKVELIGCIMDICWVLMEFMLEVSDVDFLLEFI